MHKTIIDSAQSRLSLDLKELFQYKDLFYTLAYRDLRVRYAQTFLGLLWAVLQPLATLGIFTVVFGIALQVNTGDVPYPLFALTGLTVWTYFSFVLSQAGNSIIEAEGMVKKIYFPRLIIPLSKAMVGFVDLAISFVFLLILMAWYQVLPPAQVVFLPLFILLSIVAALAVGIWLSALTIRYRDFRHVVPFLVQLGLYITPIMYPAARLLPEQFLPFIYLNPVAGIIEGYRWCLIDGPPPSLYAYISFAMIAILFVSGLFYFKKVEAIMADIV
jgi:lipopolysaccharide transport system permease protein